MALAARCFNTKCISARGQAYYVRPSVAPIARSRLVTSRASEAASAVTYTPADPSAGGLREVTKDDYHQFLEQNKDTLVIVDCYTDWCGPCKLIYPELVKLQEEMPHIRIVKFNCNKYNKELGVQLKIRVAPTFLFYKNSTKVAELTGAKLERIRAIIEEQTNPVNVLTSSTDSDESS